MNNTGKNISSISIRSKPMLRARTLKTNLRVLSNYYRIKIRNEIRKNSSQNKKRNNHKASHCRFIFCHTAANVFKIALTL